MDFINVLTYIFIFLGTVINIIFGYLFRVDFERIAIVNIVLTIVFLILSIIAKSVLTGKENKAKLSNSENKGTIQLEIPPISDKELKELNDVDLPEKDSFREVNPASLYTKNNK